ncbi:hypothetical protein M427DRAFT_53680 [Gonapodya prolifera JEL478]|uniref:Uncharacterized protein n=1 Tax=Gonapodya prolifera (strain JEL478) TaxID=1344416 RepID=A0A139APT2_GONPJ|nr:hypothetical protein M427DRAFT_53680 [Gonapodya prolifera JEL478]|eukprot:KXS18749.1 hypothetical protein M427DRAFT_53680 [Gonapodya prolifera JEL478]
MLGVRSTKRGDSPTPVGVWCPRHRLGTRSGTLESQQRSLIPSPAPTGPSPLELANAALTAQVRELNARVAAAESRAVVEAEKARVAETWVVFHFR